MTTRVCRMCGERFRVSYRPNEREFCNRACQVQAARAGLIARRPWTDSEIGFLVDNMDRPVRQVADELERSRQSVQHMKGKLKNGWTPVLVEWSADEDEALRNATHMTARAIAEQLGRTEVAVGVRRSHLARTEGLSSGRGAHKLPHWMGLRRLLAKTCPKCGLLLDASFYRQQKRGWATDCTKCLPPQRKTPESSRKQAASGRDYIARMQAITQPRAHKSREPWTERDHETLADPDRLIVEKALLLGRSYMAVAIQCSKNGYASKVGQLDPIKGQWVIDNPNVPAPQAA